ncbi:hypothetical protein Nepgr_000989 [Nepenthes gracilis]|uniref:Uncharacterized protein n=1 Tax=Nepenthes gracilis TaxID=150966 RepID=A0AAD3RXE3_NEPGR|nr:hypothetical protein Nepgr_000989 [Nepenthes gracilis]
MALLIGVQRGALPVGAWRGGQIFLLELKKVGSISYWPPQCAKSQQDDSLVYFGHSGRFSYGALTFLGSRWDDHKWKVQLRGKGSKLAHPSSYTEWQRTHTGFRRSHKRF